MIDWNGNGRIDPADIAISIALDSTAQQQTEPEDEEFMSDAGRKSQEKKRKNWLRRWFRRG